MMIITCQCNVSSSGGKDSHEHGSGEKPQRYHTNIGYRSEQGEVLITPLDALKVLLHNWGRCNKPNSNVLGV